MHILLLDIGTLFQPMLVAGSLLWELETQPQGSQRNIKTEGRIGIKKSDNFFDNYRF
jgi:hypothetical protein